MGIRPLNSWIVIRDMDADEEMIGSIYVPEGSMTDPHKWAEVLEVGKGAAITKGSGWAEPEVSVGDKVLYVRFLKNTDTGKALSHVLEREYGAGAFLIQEKDVICVESTE